MQTMLAWKCTSALLPAVVKPNLRLGAKGVMDASVRALSAASTSGGTCLLIAMYFQLLQAARCACGLQDHSWHCNAKMLHACCICCLKPLQAPVTTGMKSEHCAHLQALLPLQCPMECP